MKPRRSLPRVASVVAVRGAEVLLPWVLYREREQAIFTSVCAANRAAVQSRASERGAERDFLPRRRPGVGRTKGLTACLASGTLLIPDFEICSHSH